MYLNNYHKLSIDIETYSSNDITEGGVYKYVAAHDFDVLMIAFSIDGAPVQIIDDYTTDEAKAFIEMLTDPAYLKQAWNANFERVCLSKFFKLDLPIEQWRCTMIQAASYSLPLSLDNAAKALNLDIAKDINGKALIRYFSMPCNPTRTNGMRTRNTRLHDWEKWEAFKRYCIRDVEVEMAIADKLNEFPSVGNDVDELYLYRLDQKINDRGILIDEPFVNAAIEIDQTVTASMLEEASHLTGLDNPNSATQLKDWLSKAFSSEVGSLKKQDMPALLKTAPDASVKRVLQLRTELSKTSVKKYWAMKQAVCGDRRIRGLLQFYGANRTGRWAGRLVQVQNLPQNHISDLDTARNLVKSGDAEALLLCYSNAPDVLSQLIRTAFIAPAGKVFGVADFSAIEARVIAWLAGEQWRLDVFNTHGKIYEASASQMFKIPIEQITKGSDLRQKGKVSELALGYQGGANALVNMGALKMGIAETELPKLVSAWRAANPAIVKLWRMVEDYASEAITSLTSINMANASGCPMLRFIGTKDALFVQLPSGRRLTYYKAAVNGNKIIYMGTDQTTKQWKQVDTYGGKLVENIVQAIARDCLAYALLALDKAGYDIVMHVHDEVVIEIDEDKAAEQCKHISEIMSKPLVWSTGLPLAADSYFTKYYRKD